MTRFNAMNRIRAHYAVPAKRGMQVAFRGEPVIITSASRTGMHLWVRDRFGGRFLIHPTWEVTYPTEIPAATEETKA